MTYSYDVFVSYPRVGALPAWVRGVLLPQLKDGLAVAGLGRPPKVFVDTVSVEAGSVWPTALAEAHHRSRVVVAILCGPYFESGWCTSEWVNAVARENAALVAGLPRPTVLLPFRYNDTTDEDVGELTDPDVRDQVLGRSRADLAAFAHLVNPRADTERAELFRRTVADLCANELKQAIRHAPPWDKDWPRLPEKPISGRDPSWNPR